MVAAGVDASKLGSLTRHQARLILAAQEERRFYDVERPAVIANAGNLTDKQCQEIVSGTHKGSPLRGKALAILLNDIMPVHMRAPNERVLPLKGLSPATARGVTAFYKNYGDYQARHWHRVVGVFKRIEETAKGE